MRKSFSILVLGLFALTSTVSYGSNGAPTESPFSSECVVNSVDNVFVADNAGVLYHDVVFHMSPEFRVTHVDAALVSLTEGIVSGIDHPPDNSGIFTVVIDNQINGHAAGKEYESTRTHPFSGYTITTSPLVFYTQGR